MPVFYVMALCCLKNLQLFQFVHAHIASLYNYVKYNKIFYTVLLIKFVSDLHQVGGFSGYPNKTDPHDITEILSKVAFNTITLTLDTLIPF
jgi:hypothetical protein